MEWIASDCTLLRAIVRSDLCLLIWACCVRFVVCVRSVGGRNVNSASWAAQGPAHELNTDLALFRGLWDKRVGLQTWFWGPELNTYPRRFEGGKRQ